MENEVIATRTGRTWLGKDGIVRGVALPGAQLTLADAKENVSSGAKVGGGNRRPALMDLRKILGIDREARAYFASEEGAADVSAVALLVGSPVSRMIGNFFLGINRLHVPVRLFTDEDEALEWLKKYLA